MKPAINKLFVNKNTSIKETIRIIDRGRLGIAFVINERKELFGLVTDGDIRRAILSGIDIEHKIKDIANRNPIVLKENFSENDVKKLKKSREFKKIITSGCLRVPIVKENGAVKNIISVYAEGRNNFNKFLTRKAVKKVLITGGAGYLGSVVSRQLLDKGYRVRVLDNLTYGPFGIKQLSENKNFEFLKGDIRNISDVIKGIKDMDAVIHLAAIVGDPACAADPKKTLEINYLATKNITEACKYFQINRFIFASTCSVYGESPNPNIKLTEESPLNPVSLYAETKIKCEQSISDAIDENFSPTIFRMATLYGWSPNMRFDLAINLLAAQAVFDKKITIFGGSQWRPWLHIEDAAQGYICCLENPIEKIRGKIFNLISENYQLLEVGDIIKSICPGTKIEISDKVTDRRNYNVSSDKVREALDFRPRNKITDGVREIKNVVKKGLVQDYRDSKYRLSKEI